MTNIDLAQEVVELATKAMLRRAGIDPPKWHDVGSSIMDHLAHFPPALHTELEKTARISKALRRPSPMPGTSWNWPAG